MGVIKPEVERDHLAQFKSERSIVEPLLTGFEVSWARERRAYNTSLSAYILTPDAHIIDTFGFNTQLAFFIPHFDSMQPRLFQAINQLLNDDPLNGRVDRNTFFIYATSEQDRKAVSDYVAEHAKGWIPIVLTTEDLKQSKSAQWGIRHPIAAQIFTRDLFDQQLPLISDVDFFGREALLFDFKDATTKTQNRGLFGLRKTGKTSLMFKLMRNAENESNWLTLYYDCKKPRIRQLSYTDFLNTICDDLLKKLDWRPNQFRGDHGADRLELIAKNIGKNKKVSLIFDEIEYVSFLAKMDQHWHIDFVNFWQTLWSLQSEYRNFNYFICGVNPSVVEADRVNGVQNPLFGIVPHQYLTGLSLEELRRMLRLLGRRMGLSFDENALRILYSKYGGHPLLTRKVCSFIHTAIQNDRRERPIAIDQTYVLTSEEVLDQNMEFYFKHILNELEEFYPDEYEMLTMIVSGQTTDFVELANDAGLRRHLESYGILRIAPVTNRPTFSIGCLEQYLERETARKEKRAHKIRIVTGEKRDVWLRARTRQLIKEIRSLNVAVKSKRGFSLFQSDGVGEPEDFMAVASAESLDSFERFINVGYRSLIEQIDKSSKARATKDFFFQQFKADYPSLFDALYRIRAYRHWRFHSEHYPLVKDAIADYFDRDLGTRKEPTSAEDFMALQQITFDELQMAVQEELARLGD